MESFCFYFYFLVYLQWYNYIWCIICFSDTLKNLSKAQEISAPNFYANFEQVLWCKDNVSQSKSLNCQDECKNSCNSTTFVAHTLLNLLRNERFKLLSWIWKCFITEVMSPTKISREREKRRNAFGFSLKIRLLWCPPTPYEKDKWQINIRWVKKYDG